MKKGIDVSYANRYIDWSEAKKDINFAIIRSSFGSDLPSQIDSFFYQNANGCVKNNIPFGTYHFAYFIDEKTARDEADFAIRLANEYKYKIKFIALDIEEDSERYAQRVGANPNWTKCAITFLERIKAAGYVPVLYSNQSWLQNKLNYSKFKNYKLWYAAPGASSPKYSCAVWQYSWNGRIHGISGNVDLNFMYDTTLLDNNLNIGNGNSNSNVPGIKVGDIVEVLNPVIYGTNRYFKIYEQCYDVIEVVGDRAVIGKHGDITAAINVKNLQKYNYKTYYIVQTGDTLTSIANKYNTTVTNLIKLNPQIKNPDLIYAGDKILIK